MHALEVAERRNAGRQDVAAAEQVVAVDEMVRVEAPHQLVAARNVVARLEQRIHRLADPAAFCFPAGNG